MGKERSNINLQYDRQAEENAIDRQFQSDEWQRQFDQQVQQQLKMFGLENQRWLDQFNLQNEYNSPAQQLKRLQQVGINGSVAANLLTGGNSSGSISSSTGASSPSPSMPGSHGTGGASSPSSDVAWFSSIGQLVHSLGELAKYGADSSIAYQKVQSEVYKNISEKNVNDAQAALTNTNNALLKAFGSDKMSAEIQEALSRSFSYMCNGNLDKAQEEYYKAMEILTTDENARKNEQQPYVVSNLSKYGILIGAQTENQFSQSAAARSEVTKNESIAVLNKALTDTENGLRQGRIDSLDLQNKIDDVRRQISNRENIVDAATYQDRISAMVAQYEHAGLINKEIEADIDRKLRENDWIEVEKSLGALGHVVGMYGEMGILSTKELNALSRQQYVDGIGQYWKYLEQPDIQYKFHDRGRVVTVHGKGTKEYVNAHY